MNHHIVILAALLAVPVTAERPPLTIADVILGKDDGSLEYRQLGMLVTNYTTAISNINLRTVEYGAALQKLQAAQVGFALARLNLIGAMTAAGTNLVAVLKPPQIPIP